MTVSAWITSGAERSAPRSHSGASTSHVHRVAHAGANLVASHRAQLATLVLDCDPPHPWLELERRALPGGFPRAQRRTAHRPPVLARGAIEGDAQTLGALGGARDRRHPAAEARAKRIGTTTQPIACLTSARRGRNALHVGVELPGVRRSATIGRGQDSRVAVERSPLLLERGVE